MYCILWCVRYAMEHTIWCTLLFHFFYICQIKSNIFFLPEALSTATTSDRCQSCILAPSTGHMLNSSTPEIFVLQGDLGGERVLQKKWTTFLKAQLLCSLPDDGFPFNIIQDMFVLTPSPEDWKNTVFYGVFTSQW